MFTSRLIDLFIRQAEAMLHSEHRNAQMLHLPGKGDLIVAGDLHNHTRNFQRIVNYAKLDKHPDRVVILQELIHGGLLGPDGEDTSLNLLVDALKWSEQFPGQVHFLLANHDLAQVQNMAIMKDGYDLTERFSRFMELRFGNNTQAAHDAFRALVYALPLAAVSATGLLLTHSLPSPRDLANFDPSVLRRDLTEADYQRHGAVYQLIWGRNQNQEVLDKLSRAWWADVFICGHQQQDAGSGTIGDRMLIVDSSHNHGSLLHVKLSRAYTLADLQEALLPLAALP